MIGQLARFGTVGVANTALTALTYAVLHAAGVPALVAAPVGFLVGAANGYVWNRRWTFRSRGGVLGRYLAAQAAGLAATDGLLALGLPYPAVLVVATLFTFTACRLFVFRVGRYLPAGFVTVPQAFALVGGWLVAGRVPKLTPWITNCSELADPAPPASAHATRPTTTVPDRYRRIDAICPAAAQRAPVGGSTSSVFRQSQLVPRASRTGARSTVQPTANRKNAQSTANDRRVRRRVPNAATRF